MFVTFLFTALLAFLRSPVFSSAFNVETPVFTQCAPVQLSWDSTTGPYDVLIANQSDQCGYAVADLGEFDTNSAMWTVDIPAGWNVTISIEDNLGNDAWSQSIVVQPSGNMSCLSPELAYLAEHPGPTSSVSSGGAKASASASPGANKGSHGSAPSAHQIPSSAVLLGTIAIAIVASAFFAL